MNFSFELPPEFKEELSKQIYGTYQQALDQARRDAAITKEFLTVTEARKYLDMANNTFVTHVVDKGIPIFMIGSKRYVKRSDLVKFVEAHQIN